MASSQFRAAMQALWSELRLGEPTFVDESSLVLQADGVALAFSESADSQSVEILGSAGPLPTAPREASRIAERILQVNLANLTGSETCVRLQRQGGRRYLQCLARRGYGRARVEGLVALVEDVLQVTEYWRGELAAQRPGERALGPVSAGDFAADMMIFRP